MFFSTSMPVPGPDEPIEPPREISRDTVVSEQTHPDARLLKLVDDLAAGERTLDDIGKGFVKSVNPVATVKLEDDLIAAGYRLADEIARTPVTSVDGMRAKATSIMRYLQPIKSPPPRQP